MELSQALQLQYLVQNGASLDKNEFRDFKIETELDRKLLLGVLGLKKKDQEFQKETFVTVDDFISVSTPMKTPEKPQITFPTIKTKETQIMDQSTTTKPPSTIFDLNEMTVMASEDSMLTLKPHNGQLDLKSLEEPKDKISRR